MPDASLLNSMNGKSCGAVPVIPVCRTGRGWEIGENHKQNTSRF